ncbi:MAG: 6-carboxytetrahydropterin synthase QueD [Candidatus Auribacterota bacterium]
MFEVTLRSQFSAAHRLENYHGKCENFHGHNWKVAVVVQRQELDSSEMVIDFKILQDILERFLTQLDHTFLNELPFFANTNTTSERVAYVVYKHIAPDIELSGTKLTRVEVWEDEYCSAAYIPE